MVFHLNITFNRFSSLWLRVESRDRFEIDSGLYVLNSRSCVFFFCIAFFTTAVTSTFYNYESNECLCCSKFDRKISYMKVKNVWRKFLYLRLCLYHDTKQRAFLWWVRNKYSYEYSKVYSRISFNNKALPQLFHQVASTFSTRSTHAHVNNIIIMTFVPQSKFSPISWSKQWLLMHRLDAKHMMKKSNIVKRLQNTHIIAHLHLYTPAHQTCQQS